MFADSSDQTSGLQIIPIPENFFNITVQQFDPKIGLKKLNSKQRSCGNEKEALCFDFSDAYL